MERSVSSVLAYADQKDVEVGADELILSLGRGAAQSVVDAVVSALRQGDEATASRQHQLLNIILRKQTSAG